VAKRTIRMVSYNWDYLQPLACGDVQPEGIDLIMERGESLGRIASEPEIDATETSLSHYLIRLSRGERDLVGVPIFMMRSFRHRCFLVRRDSPLHDFADLVGKRIGTDGWANTGNTWSRAAMRERGIDIASIAWVVGPPEETTPAMPNPNVTYPPYVTAAPEGKTLVGMLRAGELDALMIPFMPRGFFTQESPIIHLFRDFRAVEKEYFQRVGYCPAIHVAALRRSVFESDPTIATRLFAAFEESKRRWREDRRRLADTTPWVLMELEETALLLGEDWQPYGVEPNRKMLATFCEEQLVQGLVTQPLDPDAAFADYESVTRG
jgi:4,5-dihydroxyphthalate decarboxylase